MNNYPPNNMAENERFSNQPPATTNRVMDGNVMGRPQPRMEMKMDYNSARMGPTIPGENMNYQQSQQQRSVPMNYQQGQRLPQSVDPVRFQQNPVANGTTIRPLSVHQNQPYQGQNPGQQFRFPGAPPQMRPVMNDPSNAPRPPFNQNQTINTPRPNYQQMDPSKGQFQRSQPNSQTAPAPVYSENFKNNAQEMSKHPSEFLSRQSSNVNLIAQKELISSDTGKEQVVKPETEANIESVKKADQRGPENPPNVESSQSEQKTSASDSVQEIAGSKESNSRSNKNSRQSEAPGKKETESKDKNITSGIVHKTIKYFEENDTAKKPLTPEIKTVKKAKTTANLPSDVIKSEFHKTDYESGVDETPMIHPNLRSIFQAPGKVARIPYLRSTRISSKLDASQKRKLKSKWSFGKPSKQMAERTNYSYSSFKHPCNKKKKTEWFSPEEELLAFFYNSRTMRTLKRDGRYKTEESAAKNKIGHKPTTNGDVVSPKKTPSKLPAPSKKNPTLSSPTKTPLKSPGTPGAKSLPKTPETPNPPTPLIKKVPMNKIQVGAAPSPNLKAVRSKVGSLANNTHKPGGGNIRIESHKIDFSKTQSRIEAKNDQYAPSGGDKKIQQVKLQWSAKSKVGSLENATYKPGGGDKKIENIKLDFKEKAKPKVGSKDNVKHVPGGGAVKIESQKLEFKAQSKVGSLDNVKHKPGGGDVKIFDDKTYLKQISGNSSEGRVSGTQSFGDLSIVREVEGRSAPGTPGRKTTVRIKKITTIRTDAKEPSVKDTTEVMVASETPKKERNVGKSPLKQQIKLTFSKISPSENNNEKGQVEVIKVPAKDHAPVLKPRLSHKEASGTKTFGGDLSDYNSEERFNLKMESIKGMKNLENLKESSNLPESKFLKNDSGMSKFLQDEMATHEKVGEIWKEMNSLGEKKISVPGEQQPSYQRDFGLSSGTNQRIEGSTSQLKSQNFSDFQKTTDSPVNFNSPQFSNILSNQTAPRPSFPQSNYSSPTINQNQQQYSEKLTQQRFPASSLQQQGNRFATPQQN